MSRPPITTHVLDTATGKPAINVAIGLFKLNDKSWIKIAQGTTNDDGRVTDWHAVDEQDLVINYGIYKLAFDLDSYFAEQGSTAFYPTADITFRLSDDRHHHIPLLLSPFGYSTYRGS